MNYQQKYYADFLFFLSEISISSGVWERGPNRVRNRFLKGFGIWTENDKERGKHSSKSLKARFTGEKKNVLKMAEKKIETWRGNELSDICKITAEFN